MKIIRLITAAALTCLAATTAQAASLAGDIRWHDERQDTLRINELLAFAGSTDAPTAQGRVGAIAREFINTPYEGGTLEGAQEMLTIDMERLDCTTLVDVVAALAKTAGERRLTWQDFAYNLENMRYRQGRMDGYASRLHYISDWAIDNIQRGNISEVTANIPGAGFQVKSLDFMTAHRDLYPALADDAEFARIKNVEGGYRNHRFPIIRTGAINKQTLAALRDGDIVALTTKTDGLDVSHLGIIAIVDGVPHLLHASSAAGKVIIDPKPLTDYLRRNRSLTGLRVFRLRD